MSLKWVMKRRLRSVQTRFPFIRPLKFAAYNFATRHFGSRINIEFKPLEKIRPAGLALDIGGNWGQSIHALKYVASPTKIISFEPNAMLADRLKRQFANDPSVEIAGYALSDKEGTFELYTPRYRNYIYDGLSSLDYEEAKNWLNPKSMAGFDAKHLSVDHQTVQIRTLDPLNLSPDIVKIDVQGAEYAVVVGGLEMFRRSKPVCIIETPSQELVDLFATVGMIAYGYDGKLREKWSGGRNTIFLSDARRKSLGL